MRSFNTMSAGFGGGGDDGNFIFLALFLLVRRDTFCQWRALDEVQMKNDPLIALRGVFYLLSRQHFVS